MMRQKYCPVGWSLTLAALLAGCEEQNRFVAPPPPEVSVAQPLLAEIADSIEFVGNTRATATVNLRARVTGYLERILFEDGAMVKEGDLLFVIDQRPFQAALDIAKAELQRAQAAVRLEQAEYRRIEPLIASRAATPQELDQAAAELATAQANVAAAEATVRQEQLQLDYTQINAPISGRIGRHLIDVGNLVQSEQTLLATIESIDPIHAYFSLSESDLLRFMEMLRANELPDPEANPPVLYLGLANETGYPHQGHLDFREFGVDPTTGTALRRGVFDNPNGVLVPGLFVRITAPIGKPKPRSLVEKRAIGTDQRGDFLLVVNDKNVVEYRLVKLGQSTDGMRVIEDGVQAEEWIVVNGLQRARPGTTVKPERMAMTMDSRDAATVSEADAAADSQEQAADQPGDERPAAGTERAGAVVGGEEERSAAAAAARTADAARRTE